MLSKRDKTNDLSIPCQFHYRDNPQKRLTFVFEFATSLVEREDVSLLQPSLGQSPQYYYQNLIDV